MSDVKFDRHIPAPTRVRSDRQDWPFDQMEVGDSKFYELEPQKIRAVSYPFARKHGVKFAISKVTEDGAEGARIWRVA